MLYLILLRLSKLSGHNKLKTKMYLRLKDMVAFFKFSG